MLTILPKCSTQNLKLLNLINTFYNEKYIYISVIYEIYIIKIANFMKTNISYDLSKTILKKTFGIIIYR